MADTTKYLANKGIKYFSVKKNSDGSINFSGKKYSSADPLIGKTIKINGDVQIKNLSSGSTENAEDGTEETIYSTLKEFSSGNTVVWYIYEKIYGSGRDKYNMFFAVKSTDVTVENGG